MEIKYYYNNQAKILLPISQEEEANINYYLKLLNEGNSYEELWNELQQLRFKYYSCIEHKKYLDGILAQETYLEVANKKYEKNRKTRTYKRK